MLIRRARKPAREQAVRDGLVAAPKKKLIIDRAGAKVASRPAEQK